MLKNWLLLMRSIRNIQRRLLERRANLHYILHNLISWAYRPVRLELYDEVKMFWPGFDEPQTCFLFRYEYLIGDEALMNIAIAAPEVQRVTADLTHRSPEDIYCIVCGRRNHA